MKTPLFAAPSIVPKIRVKKTWHSYIELSWDEIPLAQRNGIVQSYKIFYWDEEGHTESRKMVYICDLLSCFVVYA